MSVLQSAHQKSPSPCGIVIRSSDSGSRRVKSLIEGIFEHLLTFISWTSWYQRWWVNLPVGRCDKMNFASAKSSPGRTCLCYIIFVFESIPRCCCTIALANQIGSCECIRGCTIYLFRLEIEWNCRLLDCRHWADLSPFTNTGSAQMLFASRRILINVTRREHKNNRASVIRRIRTITCRWTERCGI